MGFQMSFVTAINKGCVQINKLRVTYLSCQKTCKNRDFWPKIYLDRDFYYRFKPSDLNQTTLLKIYNLHVPY